MYSILLKNIYIYKEWKQIHLFSIYIKIDVSITQ